MIERVKRQYTKEEVLTLLDPLIRKWFNSKFEVLTEPQSFAVPLIHEKKNVLITSPTGSGKTLTAFLSIINELYKLQRSGDLEDCIYCVYVSPLKALANDINRNLTKPLEEMRNLAESVGIPTPEIRVAVRSGDTTAHERQKQARKPPHIYITTPESLTIVLSTPKFRENLKHVRYVIIDEIHEICSSKRGSLLAVSLERLQEQAEEQFTRIGLSATIAPIEEEAKFLAGFEGKNPRNINIVEVDSRKSLDLKVLCPVADMTRVTFEESNARMYNLLDGLIDQHRTTLIFTNTRSGTEHVSFKLKERGIEDLEAHHGSLSKVTRLDVEEKLKNGYLKAVVSSTSLELGIDIGFIDLVCQIGSPKSVAKGLQRIGRAGHAYGGTSIGRLIVFDNDDLVECATLANAAYRNDIDRVDIPRNTLDVLSQTIVGMSLERRWDVNEAFELLRRSYPFHTLSKKDFTSVLEYLSSRNPDIRVYAKIWYDKKENRFGRKKGTRLIYFTNVGTIPEEGSYHVFSERGVPLGELSENFVEYLKANDIFVLGGRTYQFVKARGMNVYVKDASGRRPTVPSWVGEMLPRSYDLSLAVGAFRRQLLQKINNTSPADAEQWLMDEYYMDEGSASSIISYVQEQRGVIENLPTDRQVLIEGYIDVKGNRNLVFHYSFGRRVNDALSRAYAYALSEKLKCNVAARITDDNFMLTVPKRVNLDDVEKLVGSQNIEELLRRAIKNTELFKQRFRHCATRSFMVLRSYKGREVSIGRQQLRSQRVLDWFHEIEDFPVIKETYNEIMNEVMDLQHAKEVVRQIEKGDITVKKSDFSEIPSPFAHNVVLLGISDIILMEDRSALLRELHRQVLKRVVPLEDMKKFQFEEDRVAEYFKGKWPRINAKKDIITTLEFIGAANIVQQKGDNIYDHIDAPFKQVRQWAQELIDEGNVQSVWTPRGVLYAQKKEVPYYASIYSRKIRLSKNDGAVLQILEKKPLNVKELEKSLNFGKEEIIGILKKLERNYLVKREGVDGVKYSLRTVMKASYDQSLDRLLTRILDVHGPMTVHELAFSLDMKTETVEAALRDLENEGVVSSGNFVIGEEYQFMLTKDMSRLHAQEEERKVFDEATVKSFRFRKHFKPMKTIDDYFQTFLEAGMVYDVFNHVSSFSFSQWLRKRRKGEIIEGRFLRGRVRYIKAKDASLFLSAYPQEPLTDFEKRVLEVIRKGDGMDIDQIAKSVGGKREKVREAVFKLDSNVYIIRRFNGEDGWTSKNVYEIFNCRKTVKDAKKKLIQKFLKAYGPVPFSGIRDYTRFPWDELSLIVENLEEEGKVERILVTGMGEQEMLILADEIKGLEKVSGKRISQCATVLSLYDPWLQSLWAQIASKWGEGWFYPVVKDGDLLGMVEVWEMSGCIEVREIDISNESTLPEVLSALDRLMKYYNQKGVEILRITRALRQDIPDLKSTAIFERSGFHRVGDFLAKGNFMPISFEKNKILSYILSRQGINPTDRFESPVEAIKALCGLRSDLAARLRSRHFETLDRLHRHGAVTRGIGITGYWTFCTEDQLRLWKRARNVVLSPAMKKVLGLVKEFEPISRSKLIEISPFSRFETSAALRKLHTGMQVTRDANNRYRRIGDTNISVDKARRTTLKKLFLAYGIFSAESVSLFMRFALNMSETRNHLRELERENFLVKGFFVEGEKRLYWMLKKEVNNVKRARFSDQFVLTPMDDLSLFLREEIVDKWQSGNAYVIFDKTEMIGAFKARKRGSNLTITNFEGEDSARAVLRRFEEENEIMVGEGKNRITDDEILRWFETMYGKSIGK